MRGTGPTGAGTPDDATASRLRPMSEKYTADWCIATADDHLTDARQVRAVYDGIYVADRDGDGKYTAHSSSGRSYAVDVKRGDCECPDSQNRDGGLCKHCFAALYFTGCAPLPISVLDADEIVVDEITSDDGELTDLDLIDHYREVSLDGDDEIKAIKWCDDGELVGEQTGAEPEPPAVGADLDAEREMVHEQEQQAAADGGDEIARCGAECDDGTECRNPVGDADRCHLHRADDDVEQEPELEIDADASSDDATALANAATDGGAVIETANADVLDRVLELADDRPLIVVVAN